MNTHNLTDEELYPMVHFYTYNWTVNIFTKERIVAGDILKVEHRKLEVKSVTRDSVCNTLDHKYPWGTKFNVVKFKPVA